MNAFKRVPFGDMGSFMYAAAPLPSGEEDRSTATITELPAEMLRGFLEPGSKEWMEFARTSHVLRRKLDDGPAVVSISRLPSAGGLAKMKSKAWLPSQMDESTSSSKNKTGRTFELAQLFSDRHVIDKFSLTTAQINRYRALASVDLLAAGREMQQLIRSHEGFETAKVSTAKYAVSWKAARESVWAHAARFPLITVTTDALFVGDKLFIYSTRDRDAWSVRGSERTASLVRAVHRMVEATSPETIIFALGPELTVLDIDIIVAGAVLSPCREQHMGPHSDLPLNSSSSFLDGLSSVDRKRLMALVSAVEPVEIDGEPMGSAVRVSKNHAITCEHLISAPGVVTLSGRLSLALRPISRDMWYVETPGAEVNWPLRRPVVNEMVVLCYRRYDTLNWFGPVRILSADRVQLTYTKAPGMTGGMSGAAIVSINDFSMLGIHEGSSLAHAIGSVYSPRMHTELWRAEPSLSEPGGITRVEPYAEFVRRGLRTAVDAVYDCIDPIYSFDTHCGSLLRVADLCVFPRSMLAVVDEGRPKLHTRTPDSSSLRYANSGDPEHHFRRPALIRAPVFGEHAAIVSRDREGEYSSSVTCPVSQLDVRSGGFEMTIDTEDTNTSFMGAVVVALADGAVLGMVTHIAIVPDLAGVQYYCTTIDTEIVGACVQSAAAREITASLPFIRLNSWPVNVQQAVVQLIKTAEVEPSIQHAADLGRTIVLSRFNMALDQKRYPQDNRAPILEAFRAPRKTMMRMSGAHRENFRSLINIDIDSGLEDVTSKLAAVMEALVGLCMLYDKPETVDRMIEFFYHDL